MKRVEIVAAQAIQEDLLDALEHYGVPKRYTIIPIAHGVGSTNPKLGNEVWPEENFILIIYCQEEMLDRIEQAITLIEKKYDQEGIGYFVL